MLKDRVAINHRLQELLREASIKWGVEIDSVEIKDVDIPEQMQRAIAKEAEAIREKRARIIRAEGEQEAARSSPRRRKRSAGSPGALELRRLQTLSEIGVEHNSDDHRHASGRAGPCGAQDRRHARSHGDGRISRLCPPSS